MPALRRGTKPPPRAARQPDAAAAAAAERDDSDGDDDSDAPEELTTAAAAASASASAAAARAAAAALAARERESRAERAARAAERDEERRRKREEEGKGKGKKKTSDGNGDNGDDVEEEGLDLLPQDVLLKLAAARRKGTIAPGRLASAAEDQAKRKQSKALKLKKKKLTKRVAGPVTVVALDAALASPSGATPSSLAFLQKTRGSRPRSASMLLPPSALSKGPPFGFGSKKKKR